MIDPVRAILVRLRSWSRRTDEEHIERLRQGIIAYDRWRGFVVSLSVFALIVLVVAVFNMLSLVKGLSQFFGKAAGIRNRCVARIGARILDGQGG